MRCLEDRQASTNANTPYQIQLFKKTRGCVPQFLYLSGNAAARVWVRISEVAPPFITNKSLEGGDDDLALVAVPFFHARGFHPVYNAPVA